MAYNDTTLLIVSDADPSKRARFDAASITPGQTRVITIPDQDMTLGDGSAAVQGTAEIDFGAFPGASDASIAITGQTSIVADSCVQAWLRPVDTDDHTADEHLVETLRIEAGNIVPGVGFTIYGFNSNQLSEVTSSPHQATAWYFSSPAVATSKVCQPGVMRDAGGQGTRIYGKWAIQWQWS